jgi:hypothetical protein
MHKICWGYKKRLLKKAVTLSLVTAMSISFTGCNNEAESTGSVAELSATKEVSDSTTDSSETTDSFIPDETMIASELTDAAADLAQAAASLEVSPNINETLSVPTYITKVDDTWFIVDCYHNQVIYNTELSDSLYDWKVLTNDCIQPHTIASDGQVYLIDDTENNRVLIFEKSDDKFVHTQTFNNIGSRPHYVIYNESNKTFYVWSSTTGEMYLFRHSDDDTRMYLTETLSIPELNGIYVRSFTLMGDKIIFVSGVSGSEITPKVLVCSLNNLEIQEEYTIPSELAGMVQITPIGNKLYVTVSTDSTGNQDYATIVRTDSLKDLSSGTYEDIYSTYFAGGGTPYYITNVDGTYYLTEHRLTNHSIWSFTVDDTDTISSVTTIYPHE